MRLILDEGPVIVDRAGGTTDAKGDPRPASACRRLLQPRDLGEAVHLRQHRAYPPAKHRCQVEQPPPDAGGGRRPAAGRRTLSAARPRLPAAQFHESWSRSAAVRVDRQTTHFRRRHSRDDRREAVRPPCARGKPHDQAIVSPSATARSRRPSANCAAETDRLAFAARKRGPRAANALTRLRWPGAPEGARRRCCYSTSSSDFTQM